MGEDRSKQPSRYREVCARVGSADFSGASLYRIGLRHPCRLDPRGHHDAKEIGWLDVPYIYIGRQVVSTFTGISFLTGIVSSDGGSILKSLNVAGIVPITCISFPWAVT